MKAIASSFLVFWAAVVATAQVNAIPNLQTVEPGLYRGGRPDFEGLKALKEAGLKTIVNLEDHEEHIERSREHAAALGLNYISIPMSWMDPPTDELVGRVMNAIASAELRPVLVNCKHGRDRTGMIVGLYRVFHNDWNAGRAYAEMLEFGFRPEFVDLDRYFKERTRGR